MEQTPVKATTKKKVIAKKTKKNVLKIDKQIAELCGMLAGIYAPDKKEIRRMKYEEKQNLFLQ